MKYLKVLLFPALLPFYAIFFILMAGVKAVEKTLSIFSKLPDLFAILFALASGLFVYYDYNHNDILGLTTSETNDFIIRVVIGAIAFFIAAKIGIMLCRGVWYLISLLIKGIGKFRLIFEYPFFFIHRYFKSTIFAILNKEYAYSDNNVYKVSDIDKSKFKIVKIKNKNMIYPLAFDYNVE